MVLGLEHGRTAAGDVQAKDKTRKLVREFARRFEARRDSCLCRDLLGTEIDTPEKQRAAREKGLFTTVCPKIVQDAAEILEEIL